MGVVIVVEVVEVEGIVVVVVYTVTQDDVDNGFVSNQALAEGVDPMGVVVNDLSDDNSNFEDDPTLSVLCQDPSMSVEKTGVFNSCVKLLIKSFLTSANFCCLPTI